MDFECKIASDTSSSCSSSTYPSDYFNQIIGYIEDIVISVEFQKLQNDFLDKNCTLFTNDEENKIYYMEIFNEYTNLIEHFILANLKEHKFDIDMDRFLNELRLVSETFDGEIYELLYSLSDFQTFKTLILDYKDFKNNKYNTLALSDCIVVTKLN